MVRGLAQVNWPGRWQRLSVGARAVDVDQRAVVFGHGLLRLELSIRTGSDGAVIDGIVSGELQLLGWEDPAGRRWSVTVDRFGRFVIEAGRSVRVRMRAASGNSTIITPWVVLA